MRSIFLFKSLNYSIKKKIIHHLSIIIENQLKKVYISGLAAIVINSTNIHYEEGFGYHSPSSNDHLIDPLKSIFVITSLFKFSNEYTSSICYFQIQ